MHKILLAIQPRLLREAVKRRLREQPHVTVVGEVDNELDLLLAIRATEANIVLHGWHGDAMPAIYTHLLQEFPGLRLVGLLPNGEEAVLCEQKISTSLIPGRDVAELISSLPFEAPLAATAAAG